MEVIHNTDKNRWQVEIDGRLARTEYIRAGERIIFTHTEVPPEFEGKGIGSALARTGLDYAREKSLKVVPLCPYIASYMRRHPEYKDLLAEGFNI